MKRLSYDSQANAAYAHCLQDKIEQTVEINPDINVDISAKGRVVGIEVLNAKTVFSKAFGIRLNAADLEKIEYEIEEKVGVYLHLRYEKNKASFIMPARLIHA